jgi:predicted TIM-barrel fold metal-dependent hydrolase
VTTIEEYKAGLRAYFDASLPARIYDAHFHLATSYKNRKTCTGEPVDEYLAFTEGAICRPISGGLLMTSPSSRHTAEWLADENEYVLGIAKERGFKLGYVVSPTFHTAEAVDAYIGKESDVVRALKPYLCYSTAEDNFEADISQYTPEWMFEVANDRAMPIILHLSHYGDMLSDENNIRELRYFSKKYPKAKIVLAHCAMGHHVRKLRLGLEKIADLENIYFDCSGSSETMSIYYCLKAFGVSRMMWGGDFAFGAQLGRVLSFGANFLGLHDGYLKSLPRDYRYEPLDNTTECTLALLEACELLSLGKSDLEAIFYDNAKAIYG